MPVLFLFWFILKLGHSLWYCRSVRIILLLVLFILDDLMDLYIYLVFCDLCLMICDL